MISGTLMTRPMGPVSKRIKGMEDDDRIQVAIAMIIAVPKDHRLAKKDAVQFAIGACDDEHFEISAEPIADWSETGDQLLDNEAPMFGRPLNRYTYNDWFTSTIWRV